VAAKAKVLSLQDGDGWRIVQARDKEALGVQKWERIVALRWDEDVDETAGHIFLGKDAVFLRLTGNGRPQEELLFRYGDTTLLGNHN
jgi:hypothetical protein